MPNALARPERSAAHIGHFSLPDTVLRVVREALRGAVAAPTDREAMDLAGAALVQLAELARAEVRHG